MVEDDLHGQGIVEVDPEGFLFVPVESAHRCLRQLPDVVIEGRAVGCRDLAVTKKGYPIGPVDQIGFQEPVPGRVVYLQYGGGIVFRPVLPQFRFGRRQGRTNAKQKGCYG